MGKLTFFWFTTDFSQFYSSPVISAATTIHSRIDKFLDNKLITNGHIVYEQCKPKTRFDNLFWMFEKLQFHCVCLHIPMQFMVSANSRKLLNDGRTCRAHRIQFLHSIGYVLEPSLPIWTPDMKRTATVIYKPSLSVRELDKLTGIETKLKFSKTLSPFIIFNRAWSD